MASNHSPTERNELKSGGLWSSSGLMGLKMTGNERDHPKPKWATWDLRSVCLCSKERTTRRRNNDQLHLITIPVIIIIYLLFYRDRKSLFSFPKVKPSHLKWWLSGLCSFPPAVSQVVSPFSGLVPPVNGFQLINSAVGVSAHTEGQKKKSLSLRRLILKPCRWP